MEVFAHITGVAGPNRYLPHLPFFFVLSLSLSLLPGKGGYCPFRAFFPLFCPRSLQEEFCPRTSDTGVVHSKLTKRHSFFQFQPSFLNSSDPNQFPQIQDALVQIFSGQFLVHFLRCCFCRRRPSSRMGWKSILPGVPHARPDNPRAHLIDRQQSVRVVTVTKTVTGGQQPPATSPPANNSKPSPPLVTTPPGNVNLGDGKTPTKGGGGKNNTKMNGVKNNTKTNGVKNNTKTNGIKNNTKTNSVKNNTKTNTVGTNTGGVDTKTTTFDASPTSTDGMSFSQFSAL